MNEIAMMKDVCFEELHLGIRTSCKLIGQIHRQHWSFQPADNMRSLKELTEHLAAIPTVDLAIVNEASEEEVRKLEANFAELDTPEAFVEAMEAGTVGLVRYFREMPDDLFLNKKTKPFYAPVESTQAKWLVEIITHVFHHRAQLFQYLKQLGYPVNMFDLYG